MQKLIRDLNLFCFDDDGCAVVSQKSNKIGPNRIIYWQAQFFAATSYMTIITCPKFICSRDVEILKRFVTT